jgi:hypothetical protein
MKHNNDGNIEIENQNEMKQLEECNEDTYRIINLSGQQLTNEKLLEIISQLEQPEIVKEVIYIIYICYICLD